MRGLVCFNLHCPFFFVNLCPCFDKLNNLLLLCWVFWGKESHVGLDFEWVTAHNMYKQPWTEKAGVSCTFTVSYLNIDPLEIKGIMVVLCHTILSVDVSFLLRLFLSSKFTARALLKHWICAWLGRSLLFWYEISIIIVMLFVYLSKGFHMCRFFSIQVVVKILFDFFKLIFYHFLMSIT